MHTFSTDFDAKRVWQKRKEKKKTRELCSMSKEAKP
jgi:hypothetical protein